MNKILTTALLLISGMVSAQDLIRFTGVVLDKEEFKGVYGTAILNTTRAKGAVSDSLGFFTIQALPGDTLLFSDIRFETSIFVVPEVLDQADYGIIQLMVSKTQVLDEVDVYALPTEEEFKEAFLSLELKPELPSKTAEVRRSLWETLRETYENDKAYYEMWANTRIYELTGQIPPNHFLDPIRWTNFIRDFKDRNNDD